MQPLLVALPALLHVSFFYLESIAYPRSVKVQKLFTGPAFNNADTVRVAGLLLFNQGFYNLFLALATLYGLVMEEVVLVRAINCIYVGAGAVLAYSSPKMWKAAAVQAGPALLVLLLN